MSTHLPPFQRIAILCAVAQEAAPLRKRLHNNQPVQIPALSRDLPREQFKVPCWEGLMGGREIRLVVSGMGPLRAAVTARRLLNTWKPDLLLVAGVAGALDPQLQVGNVMAASEVVTPRKTLYPALILPAPRTGRLLSLNQVLVTAAEKQNARTGHGNPEPLAVDMETAAVVAVAEKEKIPWAAVRAISDTASEGLPLDFNTLRGRDGDLSIFRVAIGAIRQPSAIPGLLRLGSNTSQAAEALAKQIEDWIDQTA